MSVKVLYYYIYSISVIKVVSNIFFFYLWSLPVILCSLLIVSLYCQVIIIHLKPEMYVNVVKIMFIYLYF